MSTAVEEKRKFSVVEEVVGLGLATRQRFL
jgi:hypothetical protein